ncbi:MAG: WD40 repeat domain-containing protein [Planctomycetes bacterium]|nr:WD40 repeat domain-containing protein [Planctomycetota bacterium]
MIGLCKRVVILFGLFSLVCLFAYSHSTGAPGGKKDEPKKEVKKDDAKKDEAKKDDKKESKDKKEELKEEPKKEPFVLDAPAKELKGHKDWIFALTISADGKYFATAGRDGTVKIWDVEAGKDIQTLKPAADLKPQPDREIKGLAFLDGAAKVASSTGRWNKEKKYWEGEIKIWDAKTGKQIRSLKGHGDPIEGLAISKDGKFLASGSKDQTVKIWDVAAGKDVQTLKGHTGVVHAVAFAPDGKRLASASEDGTVKIWDHAAGKDLLTLTYVKKEEPKKEEPKKDDKKNDKDKKAEKDKAPAKDKEAKDKKNDKKDEKKAGVPRSFTCVAFTPDGKKVIAGNLDGVMKIWDVDTGKELGELKSHEGVWAIAFNSDGSRMATGGWDKTIRVWDTASWKELFVIKAHDGTVTTIAFSPSGQQIASGGIDGVLRLWSATTAPTPPKK